MIVRFVEAGGKNEKGTTSIVFAAILMLLAATIIFVASLADKETREAFEKVNTVPVENSAVMGKE